MRRVVITGGSRGIGAATVRRFTAAGDQVYFLYEKSTELARQLEQETGAVGIACDISQEDAVNRAFRQIGPVDVLVNIAGIIVAYYRLDDMKEENWDLTFDVNVKGLMQMCREFVKRLKAKGLPGNIVNVSSNGAKVCFDNMADYNASKAAVMNLTQSMALEWAADHINVNAVCPGAVDTAMLRKCMDESIRLFGGSVEEMRKTWGPPQLGRLIQPYEVGRVIRFLASEDAVIIRGQSISVDGGNTRW